MGALDLTGQVFGQLRVLSFSGSLKRYGRKERHWLCECDCGIQKTLSTRRLRSGNDVSCGCRRIERAHTLSKTHGMYGTRTYGSWCAARARCNNPGHMYYHNYGGRGIRFHEPWEDFEVFLADVGPAPTEKHTIDRIDPDGNYEPGNVRWATMKEQNNNKRNSKKRTDYNYSPEEYAKQEWAF